MGRKRLCRTCGGKMEGPDYIKTKVPLPPETDCPECEKYRMRGSRLTFVKAYTCPKCEKVTTIQMTPEEIKAHRHDFHWGSSDITPQSKDIMVKKAKKAQAQEKETEEITKEIIDKIKWVAPPQPIPVSKTLKEQVAKELEEQLGWKPVFPEKEVIEKELAKSPLEKFLDKVRACPDVNRVYLTDPPAFAPHLLEQGWEIFELHIVPNGRPPYFALEAVFAGVEKEGDPISEMIGERVFLKITDKIHLVRIIEQPDRLGHI